VLWDVDVLDIELEPVFVGEELTDFDTLELEELVGV
jgi:hypothetical protein